MPKKYLVLNNHSNLLVNKWTIEFVRNLCKENKNLKVLFEGIPSGVSFPKQSEDVFGFYSKLCNSLRYDKLTKKQGKFVKEYFDIEQLENMPFTLMLIGISEFADNIGIDIIDSSLEEEPKVDSTEDFVEGYIYSNPTKKRDDFMREEVEKYNGDCVVIIGGNHIIHWLESDLLESKSDYFVVVPTVNKKIIPLKEAINCFNKAYGKKIKYDSKLDQEVNEKTDKKLGEASKNGFNIDYYLGLNEFKYDMECFSENDDIKEILGGMEVNQSDG